MEDKNIEKATFGAGCFWGVEEVFRKTNGVIETEVGYSGGTLENPSYEDVKTGKTGHVESVLVKFNPKIISYSDLLNVFWKNHNPTTLNQQGPDFGSQYRSVIFYNSEEQRRLAETSKNKLETSGIYDKPIVTEIIPASVFYGAEEYHQKYIQKGGFCA